MKKRLGTIIASVAVAGSLALAPAATAANLTPQQVAGSQALSTVSPLEATPEVADSAWYKQFANDDRVMKLQATSPAMNGRVVPLAVIPAGEANRPTIYLLNGAGGAEQDMDWTVMSQVVDFYSDLKVNVVIPQAGAFSYYTDWKQDPNGTYLKGPQKWETFLTKELPGPIERHLQANNKRAVAGMSMSATSALLFAQHNPGFYDAVGSFAGCAATADPATYEFTRLTVNRGGGQPEQMWGRQGSATNRWNDALINAAKLRGTELYISSGSGLAGKTDMPSYYTAQGIEPVPAVLGAATLQIEGGAIEAAVNHCTHNLKAKLDKNGIPADYNFRNVGTHSWPGWREDIEKSWATFWRAFYA
ncbi:alpha/beta hydrolase [Corynebacterium endometrii]|uniref:Diacylglycerol acyltransferase/mycolyltransferase Ag85A n=1 Tax=Corynebacterium endometrii TaxID=2488819 RepID=A0A4P7QDU0_9CORY|nr:alpha/beta hydrolase family protein [Corynebacterium endometrii]QCB27579.1 Diacylglycerol acyltransferase/mycolyltransferase Ag85A precursor [Corynebacterium endometrii]